MTHPRITSILCFIVLCGILAVGLSPFHVPRNAVSWLAGADGLQFDRYGSVISSAPFPDSQGQACSFEVWLQPFIHQRATTVLAFYTPESPRRFQLLQLDDDLVLTGNTIAQNPARLAWYRLRHAFRSNKPILVTMTSGGQTAIYLDGVRVEDGEFRFVPSNFMGELVLGTSPVSDEGWVGQIRGLAFYNRELDSDQVALHYQRWISAQPDDLGASNLYRFNERAGEVVHNAVHPGIDLRIPPQYRIPHPNLLESPWKGFRNDWGYWEDILVNIGGFIPFGFLFGIYFSVNKHAARPKLAAILSGAAVSLVIEITQAYLPTRDSSLTDFLTNTLGAVLGVYLQDWKPVRSIYDWSLDSMRATRR